MSEPGRLLTRSALSRIGIFLPLFWIIGAIMPPTQRAEAMM